MYLLTDLEERQIIMNSLYDGARTEEYLETILTWARKTRVNETLLKMVLDGTLAITGNFEPDGVEYRMLDDEEQVEIRTVYTGLEIDAMCEEREESP